MSAREAIMNSRAFRPKDVDAALMYAPPWAREVEPEPESNADTYDMADAGDVADVGDMDEMPPEDDGMPPAEDEAEEMPSFLGDRAMLHLRRRLSLEPEIVPPPPILLEERPSALRIAVRLCAVTAVAALVAWVVVSYSRLRLRAHEMAQTAVTDVASAMPSAVKLVQVHAATPAPDAAPPDGPAAVAAFAAEEKASAQAPPSAETPPPQQPDVSVAVKTPAPANAWPTPPQQPNESVAVQTAAPAGGWPPPPQQPGDSVAVQGPAPQPTPPAADAGKPAIDADEIAVLVDRGKAFLNDGDVVSARLLLRRAADAGNAEAALALGASYDPLVIKQTGAVGVHADPEQARQWYQKAAELGSTVASRQLANLANANQ
jgi:hypothetical protein